MANFTDLAGLRTLVAAVFIAGAPAAAFAQHVDKVPDGDTLVVHGVGKVHLLGIKSADGGSPVQIGPTAPPQPVRREPPTTPAVSGTLNLSHDRAARDLLRKLALGRTVRIEYDPLVAGSKGEPSAYLYLDDGTLLNAEMLKAGQARLDDTRQFEREQEFRRLEAEAQSAAVGIWIR